MCAAAGRYNRPAAIRRLPSDKASLTRTVLDHLLDLGLYSFKVERSRSLHRRIVDRGLRQLSDVLLHLDEAPELPAKEVIAVAEGAGVSRLAANSGRALEGILAVVNYRGLVGGGFSTRPPMGLLEEHKF